MEDLNLWFDYQYVFYEKCNTTGAISEMFEKLYINFDNGTITHGEFLDFSKAFDTVDQTILINKLK